MSLASTDRYESSYRALTTLRCLVHVIVAGRADTVLLQQVQPRAPGGPGLPGPT